MSSYPKLRRGDGTSTGFTSSSAARRSTVGVVGLLATADLRCPVAVVGKMLGQRDRLNSRTADVQAS